MNTTDHEHPPIDDAARWFAEYGPVLEALNECKVRFSVSASLLSDLSAAAAKIRREGREVEHG